MTRLRPDLLLIADAIPAGARVIDVGCGDGALIAALSRRGIDARGLELAADQVALALARGAAVVQGDADQDLADYPAGAFSHAVLSQTLQTTRRPDRVIDELLRIAPVAFVSFPNFGHWRVRAALALGGRMPVTASLPAQWYDTPNIHHLTLADFRAFCDDRAIRIKRGWALAGGRAISGPGAAWRAEQAVFAIARS